MTRAPAGPSPLRTGALLSLLAVGGALVLGGCTAPTAAGPGPTAATGRGRNLLGRGVRVTEHPFSFGGAALSYFEGTPEVPDPSALPVVVFVDGDGSMCQPFGPGIWTRFLERYTGDYVLVWPRTRVNTVCETDAFAGQDFLSRVDELAVVRDDLQRRHPGRPLVLLGQSAGAHVAILLAQRDPGRIAAVANLSGGVDALLEVLAELRRAKSPDAAGRAEAEQKLQTLADGLRAGERLGEPMWGRTRAFWREMFFSGADAAWRSWRGACWIAHGTEDTESVPYSLVARRASEPTWKASPCTFRFYDGLGHALLTERTMRDFNGWLRQVLPAGGTAPTTPPTPAASGGAASELHP